MAKTRILIEVHQTTTSVRVMDGNRAEWLYDHKYIVPKSGDEAQALIKAVEDITHIDIETHRRTQPTNHEPRLLPGLR